MNLQNDKGQTALWVACERGNSAVVRTLLRDHRVDVHFKTNTGSTALNVASLNGHDEVVRLLEEHVTRVPAVDGISSQVRSPMDLDIIMEEHSSMARGWVDRTPRTIGGNERTATSLHPNQQLIRAARGGKLHEVRNLLQVGADVNTNDDRG